MKPIKTTKIIQLLMWSFLLVALGGGMIHLANRGKMNINIGTVHIPRVDVDTDVNGIEIQVNTSHMKVAKEESVQLEGIDFINMKLASADVEVSFVEGSEVRVVESTNDEDEKELFEMSQSGNMLNIIRKEEKSNYYISFGERPYHKVEVFIPIRFKEKLATETSSGDIKLLSNTYLQGLEINTTSGNFNCEKEIEVNKVSISSTSGDKEMSQLKSISYEINASSGELIMSALKGTGRIESTSGDVRISQISGENHEIATSSGDIEVEEGQGNFTIESTSGYKKIGSLVGSEHFIESSSGDIDIEELEGNGNIETTSGRVAINTLIEGKIDINTSSGSVIIKQLEGYGRVSSTAGEIIIDVIQLRGDMMLTTSSGEVDIRASKDVNANVEVETSSGDIGGNIEMNYENKNENKATSQLGNGKENIIKIETASGDVVLSQD